MRAAAIALLALLPGAAWAHGLQPAILDARELGDGRVHVVWRPPLGEESSSTISPQLPAACRAAPGDTRAVGRATTWTARCALEGATLSAAGLEPGVQVFVRVTLADGRSLSAVLTDGDAGFTVPARQGGGAIAQSYLVLGVEHILTGWDHLTFVVGLLLLVTGVGALVRTLTAFTLAHSVTLALAALDVVQVSAPLVEALIALSIAVVAVEVVEARRGAVGLGGRRPWGVAFGFGLLHGLGFSSALGDVGLPAGHAPLALATFNVGVELGQLAFVAAVILATRAAARLWTRPPAWPRTLAAEAMGAVAALWCLERTVALWA